LHRRVALPGQAAAPCWAVGRERGNDGGAAHLQSLFYF
jgi:hypothetical protein